MKIKVRMFGFAKSVEKPSEPQTGGLFSTPFGYFSTTTDKTQQVGTTIKFVAPSGTDSISMNCRQVAIKTNHQCITATREYESKTLERAKI